MDTAIGTLLDRLQGLTSKGFLLAGYLPSLVFICLNLALTYIVFPDSRDRINAFFKAPVSEHIFLWLGALLFSFVLGVTFSSLNPWFRQALEGQRLLPGFIIKLLERRQGEEFTRFSEKEENLEDQLLDYRKALNKEKDTYWPKALKDCRRIGNGKEVEPQPVNKALIKQINKFKKMRQEWKAIPFNEMEKAFTDLKSELLQQPAENNDQLDSMQIAFVDILKDAKAKIESEHARVKSEWRMRFPKNMGNLRQTSMANLTEVHREHGLNRYGMDFEIFWLRILKFARADTIFYPIIEEAKTQLDFSVSATFLTGLTTLIWIPVTLCYSPTGTFAGYSAPVVFLAVAILGPALTRAFYNITLQNYRAYLEAVRSAVDLYRFDLLRSLRIDLPENSLEEKSTWGKLTEWTGDHVRYKHGDANADQNPRVVQIGQEAVVKSWLRKFLGI